MPPALASLKDLEKKPNKSHDFLSYFIKFIPFLKSLKKYNNHQNTTSLNQSSFDSTRRYLSTFIHTIIAIFLVAFIFELSFFAFLRDIFGVSPDMHNVTASIFATDFSEASEFAKQYARYILVHFGLFVFLVSVFIWLLFNGKKFSKHSHISKALMIAAVLFIILHANPTMRKLNPFVFYFSSYHSYRTDLAQLEELGQSIKFNLPKNISASYASHTFILVIGESHTRANSKLFGYTRDTEPSLSAQRDSLLLVDGVRAAGANTIDAISRMLSFATTANPEQLKTAPDIITLAHAAGYKTYWLSNHSTDKWGVLGYLASRADKVVLANKGGSRGEGSYDEVLLEPFRAALDEPVPLKFIIVHLLGSHPAYHFRYPDSFSHFSGRDSATLDVPAICLAFRNSYDDSLRYTDFVLSELLRLARDSGEFALLYLSDHGQDVCHHTSFSGHNYRAKEQWEVPFIFAASYLRHGDVWYKEYDLQNLIFTLIRLLGINGISESGEVLELPMPD